MSTESSSFKRNNDGDPADATSETASTERLEPTASWSTEAPHEPSAAGGRPEASASAHRPRRSPIFGTIFWGVVLLVFAVVMAVLAIPTITVDVVALTIAALVVLGALLVVAGVAASVRNRRN
ncbi:hypothetical protein [Paramicrobacterium agarici]|uniref:Uncharacterized protein n=1 Tax=Paramicrobacterium agarici TaxID=630514 RepID=A0A2A9DU03_9MICO|nr:hypothetical protein [Microbacterium agarici]PFG30267.1 hypothetical protein ATJ78_1195 [Microbacterium agarici]TQO23274.1 hypothetical protein FB385_2123 [Microbacterium agarici]